MDHSSIAAVQRSTLLADQSSDRPFIIPTETPSYIVPALDEDNLDDLPSGDSSIQDEHSIDPFTDALLADVDLVELSEPLAPRMAVANDATIHNTFPSYLETLDTVSTPQAALFLSHKPEARTLPELKGPVETIHFDDPGLFKTIYII